MRNSILIGLSFLITLMFATTSFAYNDITLTVNANDIQIQMISTHHNSEYLKNMALLRAPGHLYEDMVIDLTNNRDELYILLQAKQLNKNVTITYDNDMGPTGPNSRHWVTSLTIK